MGKTTSFFLLFVQALFLWFSSCALANDYVQDEIEQSYDFSKTRAMFFYYRESALLRGNPFKNTRGTPIFNIILKYRNQMVEADTSKLVEVYRLMLIGKTTKTFIVGEGGWIGDGKRIALVEPRDFEILMENFSIPKDVKEPKILRDKESILRYLKYTLLRVAGELDYEDRVLDRSAHYAKQESLIKSSTSSSHSTTNDSVKLKLAADESIALSSSVASIKILSRESVNNSSSKQAVNSEEVKDSSFVGENSESNRSDSMDIIQFNSEKIEEKDESSLLLIQILIVISILTGLVLIIRRK